MSDHRYNVTINYDNGNSPGFQIVLHHDKERTVSLVFFDPRGRIEHIRRLKGCSHTADDPSAPCDPKDSLDLKSLGKLLGIDLKRAKYRANKTGFVFAKSGAGVRAPGDWEATDGGPWPNPIGRGESV